MAARRACASSAQLQAAPLLLWGGMTTSRSCNRAGRSHCASFHMPQWEAEAARACDDTGDGRCDLVLPARECCAALTHRGALYGCPFEATQVDRVPAALNALCNGSARKVAHPRWT